MPALVGALTLGAACFGGASSAWAGPGLTVQTSLPNPVTVGETLTGARQTELRIQNTSFTGPAEPTWGADSFTLTSATLVPSCGSIVVSATGDCATAPTDARDPGVIVPTPLTGNAVGRAGSACAGIAFNITVADAAQGKYLFTPASTVTLGPGDGTAAAARCIIGFDSVVLKYPGIDSSPPPGGNAGQQTDQKEFASAVDAGPTAINIGQATTASGPNQTTVRKNTPAITTLASANVPVGGALTDQATVTQLVFPTASSVTFRLYGPGDSTCTGPVIFTNNQPVVIVGSTATATSGPFTPATAGTYYWVATYEGDANANDVIAGACGEATETRNVTPPPPPGPPPPPPGPPPPPPPCTPPPGPAPPGGEICSTPPTVCTPPPGPAPAGGELCARGTAAIRGTTGCAGTPFRVVVRGRQIEQVTFALDGKTIKTLTKPNRGSLYVQPVNPRTLPIGVHRVLARTIFRKQSGTPSRTLRVTFSRCSRRAVSPGFTG